MIYLIPMYHPGRVLDIFSSKDKNIESVDNTTQAMLEMWDENLITVLVEPHLNEKIKKEDIVLVDYRPMSGRPIPKMTVTKVLKSTAGKNIWSTYKDFFKKRKQPQTPVERAQKQHYVG